jgi:hypothetical protein
MLVEGISREFLGLLTVLWPEEDLHLEGEAINGVYTLSGTALGLPCAPKESRMKGRLDNNPIQRPFRHQERVCRPS